MNSSLSLNFMKESQFLMACKLVAIYQKHLTEHGPDQVLSVLTQETLNALISQALSYFAEFNISAFETSLKPLEPQPEVALSSVSEENFKYN